MSDQFDTMCFTRDELGQEIRKVQRQMDAIEMYGNVENPETLEHLDALTRNHQRFHAALEILRKSPKMDMIQVNVETGL